MTMVQRYGVVRASEIREKFRLAKLGKPSKSSTKFRKGQDPWNKKQTSGVIY